jgi:hypothetical protein
MVKVIDNNSEIKKLINNQYSGIRRCSSTECCREVSDNQNRTKFISLSPKVLSPYMDYIMDVSHYPYMQLRSSMNINQSNKLYS